MNRGSRAIRWLFLAIFAGACFFPWNGSAEVAITEVMSAHTDPGELYSSPADYFELTNFGTNIVDLAGYRFTDADHRDGREWLVSAAESLPLGPRESIIFVRTNQNVDEAGFRAFWGSCLSPNVQVRSYLKPGLSSFGDSLTIYDANENVVDSIEFDRAADPISFVYDRNTGAFGVSSALEEGACLSVTNANLGSPGTTTGPVPLAIQRSPSSIVQCRELEATFTVEAIGMPRPRFQWLFNGEPIPGAEGQILVVSNVNSQVEGAYSVRVFNGLSNIISAPAILTMNTNPTPPTIVSAPLDRTVVEGRTARFVIAVCAYPTPTYQWYSNGSALPDETNRVLLVPNCSSSMAGSSFCVRVENRLGSTEGCGTLYVTNISPIRITELQANPLGGCDGHNDWFEITNFGQSAAQLSGYRFSDHFLLDDAQVIKRPLLVQPRESVIFVKNSSVGTFFEWWGADQLPANLQVRAYSGFSLSAKRGDMLYLWDETAEDPSEFLDSAVFSTNSPGRTINFEAIDNQHESAPGEDWILQAVECGDIGSPGFTNGSRPPHRPPEFLGIERLGTTSTVQFLWSTVEGVRYRLESSDSVTAGAWSTLITFVSTNIMGSFSDSTTNRSRFYRMLEVLP